MKKAVLVLRDTLSQVLRTIVVAHGVRSRFRLLRWLGKWAATRMGLFLDAPDYSVVEIAVIAKAERQSRSRRGGPG